MEKRAKSILKDIFGYSEFYPLQERIINSIVEKKDSIIIMPTGGGKSLCYQIPALIFEGITVVISPLISLMKDQVEQLIELGVSAVYLNSSLSYDEYSANVEKVKSGKIKLLYLAPETLSLDRTLNLLKSVKVDSITVDEAHCISEWGHDFRPEYREIANIRRHFPDAVLSGFTATATPRVQEDIVTNLSMKEPQKFIASFDRKNLHLQIVPKKDPFGQIVKFLDQHPRQSGIIYCFSRKQVDELTAELRELNFSVLPYHAGMSDEYRKKNQELFIKDDVRIIIATIAFGMGINKPNVRFVIHHDLPKNIESYYQQIGRAGRDGLESDCLLLFGYGDIQKINYLINQSDKESEKRVARTHLDSMVQYCESYSCRRIQLLKYFGEDYPHDNCGKCDNCLEDQPDVEDVTIPAQKFLSCMKRTGELFGAHHIIEILRGANSEKVISKGHNKLTTYGIGKNLTKEQWLSLSKQFIQYDIISKDLQHGSLKVSKTGYDVLKNRRKIYGRMAVKEPKLTAKKSYANAYDEELFEVLRKLRKELADKNGVPPYVVFHDRTLAEMATYLPTNGEDFKKLSGVGNRKLNKYGKTFIKAISDYVGDKNIESRSTAKSKKSDKPKRYEMVGEDFNNGKSLDVLEEDYQVKLDTLINHLHRYLKSGNKLENDHLDEHIKLGEKLQSKILKIFEREGIRYLTPVKEELDEEVDYIQLKLMRLKFLND